MRIAKAWFLLAVVAAMALMVAPLMAAEPATKGAAGAATGEAAQSAAPATGAEPAPKAGKTSETASDGCTIEKFTLPSPSMKREIEVVVVLPPGYAAKTSERYPVLYTLHGRGAPYATFVEMRTMRRALKDKPMIVVGFNADRASWYLDSTEKADSKFTTFFFKELVPYVDKTYRTRADGKSRAVTGFSMGGYGAFHYVLAHPELFASASSMSGAFDPTGEPIRWAAGDWATLMGKPEEHKEDYARLNLALHVEALVKKGVKLPPLYVACGTEDGLVVQNRAMRDHLTRLGIKCEYAEAPGAHKWAYWATAMEGVVDFHWRSFQGDYKWMDHPAPPAAEPGKNAGKGEGP